MPIMTITAIKKPVDQHNVISRSHIGPISDIIDINVVDFVTISAYTERLMAIVVAIIMIGCNNNNFTSHTYYAPHFSIRYLILSSRLILNAVSHNNMFTIDPMESVALLEGKLVVISPLWSFFFFADLQKTVL